MQGQAELPWHGGEKPACALERLQVREGVVQLENQTACKRPLCRCCLKVQSGCLGAPGRCQEHKGQSEGQGSSDGAVTFV